MVCLLQLMNQYWYIIINYIKINYIKLIQFFLFFT